MHTYRHMALIFSTFLCAALAQEYAVAQMLPDVAVQTSDRFLRLVPMREVTEIQRDIEAAEQARLAAVDAERIAQEERTAAAKLIDEKKQAININKDRQKAAKRDKNNAEMLVLGTEGKALERDKDMLEEREALRDAEIDLSRKRIELATLAKQALELEQQLIAKRIQLPMIVVSGPDSAREARLMIDLERATLQAQKKVAEKQGEVAAGAKKVIERQLKTLDAQQGIYSGK